MFDHHGFYLVPCRLRAIAIEPYSPWSDGFECEIVEMSPKGATIRTLYPPRAIHMRLILRFNILGRDLKVKCQVISIERGRFGVDFLGQDEDREMRIAAYLYQRMQAMVAARHPAERARLVLAAGDGETYPY